ncbi:hypothetical protein [Bowdeniella nasicola]|uniref:hypothetical protein n=1 Tax=Bowdeniella nasicola TaxID=208480 RepID=UPI0011600A99|nr:hypothetical protein [Bowdeniella nasicola]
MFTKFGWPRILLALLVVTVAILWLVGSLEFAEVSSLAASALAAIVALSINETVSARRRTEIEEEVTRKERERETLVLQRRAEVYSQVLTHLSFSFTGRSGSSPVETHSPYPEQVIRTLIAFWGSQDFIEGYLNWKNLVRPFSGRGTVSVPSDVIPKVREAFAALIRIANRDVSIGGEDKDVLDIQLVIFDDNDLVGGMPGAAFYPPN